MQAEAPPEGTSTQIDWGFIETCIQHMTEFLISGRVSIMVLGKGKAAEHKRVEFRRVDKLMERLDAMLRASHFPMGAVEEDFLTLRL